VYYTIYESTKFNPLVGRHSVKTPWPLCAMIVDSGRIRIIVLMCLHFI